MKPIKNEDENYENFAIEEWKMEHIMFLERRTLMKSNKEKLYALVWGKCTQALKSEIMGLTDYVKNKKKSKFTLVTEKH